MESPLSRSQLCWTIIRVIGLFFSFTGLINLVVFIGAPSLLWILFGEVGLPSVSVWIVALLQSLGWLLLAFYFLRHGNWVHDLLMFDCVVPQAIPVLKKAPIDPKTGLTAEELEIFREWRDGNPTVRYMEIEDQVAHYRDSKAETRLFD